MSSGDVPDDVSCPETNEGLQMEDNSLHVLFIRDCLRNSTLQKKSGNSGAGQTEP